MQSGFPEAELLFDNPEPVFALGADVCLGSLDQILQTPIDDLREGAAFARPHRNPEFHFIAIHFRPSGIALAARVAV